MRIALVTTPPSIRSGIGDYTRRLLPYLREHTGVEVFVRDDLIDPGNWPGEPLRPASELEPGAFDQILYQIGNEVNHAFMIPVIEKAGGVVMLHDWILFDMAVSHWPLLRKNGRRGAAVAWREGGFSGFKTWAGNRWKCIRQRNTRYLLPEPDGLRGELLSGWHVPGDDGRWTADAATFRIPSATCKRVKVEIATSTGRELRLRRGAVVLDAFEPKAAWKPALEAEIPEADRAADPVFTIEALGVHIPRDWRRGGEYRRLGLLVTSVEYEDEAGVHTLDLERRCADPAPDWSLRDDRFNLALNRSVVRHAEGFVVHSEHVQRCIRGVRSAPVGIVHHGAERIWREEATPGERKAWRASLNLPAGWDEAFLVVSFGGVQFNKRFPVLLEALHRVRPEHPNIKLLVAGKAEPKEFDLERMVHRLELDDTIHFAGFVEEEDIAAHFHAADLAVQLRGPSTGGTSGGIFQALSHGRGVIASALDEQRELPEACVPKVVQDEREVERLAELLVDFHDNPARCVELERAARQFVEDGCHWSIVAKGYADFLASVPHRRG